MIKEESIITIDKNGCKRWINKAGEYHRIDGPAIEMKHGRREWYQFGERHRIDGPAIESYNEYKCWFIRGVSFNTKEAFFEALTDEEKSIALFSEDFLNA